jgi:5-methylcytosine-specific restriction endonuclease McrA
MRNILFDPAKLTTEQQSWWKDWSERSQTETATLIAAQKKGDRIKLKQQLWAELKAWLLGNVFHGKCAYCEAPISGGFFGEGEHYRPKSKVTVLHLGKKVAVVVGESSHPGYFWLAYDWKNLVPACQECNNRKSDLFPTARQHVGVPSTSFDQLDKDEEPLLLHPYRDDPSEHLVFGINGIIAAVDDNPSGSNTIKVFGLDREGLAERRKRRQELALAYMLKLWPEVLADKITLPEALHPFCGKDAEYSAAVQDILNAEIPKILEKIKKIKI